MDPWAALSLLICLAVAGAGLWLTPVCPGSAALLFVLGAGSAAFLLGRRPVKAGRALKRALGKEPSPPRREIGPLIEDFVRLSQKAKREGFLALESDVRALEDPLMQRGFLFVIDGASPQLLRSALELELESVRRRFARDRRLLRALGLSAAGAGVLGLFLGLSAAEPQARRFGLDAAAWGAAACLAMMRLAGRQRRRSESQRRVQEAVIHGVLLVQAGVNPNLIESSLRACLEPPAAAEAA